MDLTLPTGRSGRLTALGLTVLALAALWLLLVSPLLQSYAQRADRLQRDEIVLAHMDRLAASLPELRTRAEAMREDGDSGALTIDGASDAVAAATLQNQLQDMASAAGGTVASFETVPSQKLGNYRRIGLKVSMHVPFPVLISMLKAVEQARPPMLIDELEIHALPVMNTAAARKLEGSFTVYALRNGGDGK